MKEHATREEERPQLVKKCLNGAAANSADFVYRRGRKQNAGSVMTGCVVALAIAEERKKYIGNRKGELASNATMLQHGGSW